MSDTDRGEGAPSPGDASADGSGDTSPAGPSGVRFPHAPSPHSDPAASASLSELVFMNIAGDVEAVADMLRSHPLAQARLRRIAAGIREAER